MTAMMIDRFTLSGKAVPVDAERMLCEICSHFVEHSEVKREGDHVKLESEAGEASFRKQNGCLSIDLSCPSAQMLQLVRSSIAEHLFMFAGEEPLELNWEDQAPATPLPDLSEARVVAVRQITPHMRRLTLACADAARFACEHMHVRLLIPAKGRTPVWPLTMPDGRLGWYREEDRMAIRIYTIRSVDIERGEMDIDFVLHESDGKAMPGAEFGRTAQVGDVAGILGPGGGGVPDATDIILAGDETALPVISRIAAEAPAGKRMKIFLEVDSPACELPLASSASIEVEWLYRNGAAPGTSGLLEPAVKAAIAAATPETYVWLGCEKKEARPVRDFLRKRGHDRQRMYIVGYWQRGVGDHDH
jgi:NADPH-dependent ferric siderophore reductase